jgi:hypothetical protein
LLWPLLRTWTDIAGLLPGESSQRDEWRMALAHLNILSDFDSRLEALDAYLDLIDETLDHWGRSNGVL